MSNIFADVTDGVIAIFAQTDYDDYTVAEEVTSFGYDTQDPNGIDAALAEHGYWRPVIGGADADNHFAVEAVR